MKNIKLVTAGIILSFFTLLSSQENGDLAEVELLSSMSQQQAQFQLNAIFGSVAPTAEYDISVYRIEYHTIDPLGEPTVASGSIAFPQDPQTAFPILSYQHGTEVLRDDVSSVYGFDAINMWLSATGFITVSPDYLGLGISEMLHPYIINIPTATAVAHFLIASKTFCDDMDDLQYNDQLFLMGYSEGGYATMAAHKYLEDNYAGELPVTLSTPMAGPYDLSGVTLETILSGTEYDQPYYVAYILLAYIEHYQMGELNEFLTDYYASLLPGLFDGTHPSWQINSYLPSTPLDILRPEVLDELINDDNHISGQSWSKMIFMTGILNPPFIYIMDLVMNWFHLKTLKLPMMFLLPTVPRHIFSFSPLPLVGTGRLLYFVLWQPLLQYMTIHISIFKAILTAI